MSKEYKNLCRVLNYIDHLHIIISTITGFVSISAFASLVDIPIGLKICVITAENSIEVLVSNTLIDSNVSHDKFILINNVPK